MSITDELAQAIIQALPPDQRALAPYLLTLIATAATQRAASVPDPETLAMLQSLAGRQIHSGQSLLSFGGQSQFGDITFQGDIVGGNQYNVSLTIPTPVVEATRLEDRDTPRLFMCYSRADRSQVDTLVEALQIRGLRLWQDTEQLYLGRLARDTIEEAIETVTAFLIYLTPASLVSAFIRTVEVETAMRRARQDRNFIIIPVLDGVTPQEVDRAFAGSRIALTEYHYYLLPEQTDPARATSLPSLARDIQKTVLIPALRAGRSRATYLTDLYSISPTLYDRPAIASIDWTRPCADGIPEPEVWRNKLLPALLDLEQALRAGGRRPIALRPDGTRMSAAFGFGYVFREPTKFNLWVEQSYRGNDPQWWRTDEPGRPDDLLTDTSEDYDADGSDFTLEISITRPATAAVDKWLKATPAFASIIRRIKLELASKTVMDSGQAMAIARQIQRTLDRELGRHLPERIHVFFVGPVALAVLIGWHLNKRGVFLIYEFVGNSYLPAVQFGG